jgi:hypothetical protein
MQLIPRYLVKNKTTLIANEAGLLTEYRPVYSRHINVFTGIDNVLDFKLLNADQKRIDLATYDSIKFQAFDENQSLIIEHNAVNVNQSKGLFKVTITENDLLNVKAQYLSYNIYLVDSNNNNVTTYSNAHFGGSGVIKVESSQFPGPRDTLSVTTFTEDDDNWYSEALTAEPGINGNEALHTAAVYTDSYVGDLVVQATLDNQVIGGTVWADVATYTMTGSETEPTLINFNGVFSHLRFKATANPAEKITKVLVRN